MLAASFMGGMCGAIARKSIQPGGAGTKSEGS